MSRGISRALASSLSNTILSLTTSKPKVKFLSFSRGGFLHTQADLFSTNTRSSGDILNFSHDNYNNYSKSQVTGQDRSFSSFDAYNENLGGAQHREWEDDDQFQWEYIGDEWVYCLTRPRFMRRLRNLLDPEVANSLSYAKLDPPYIGAAAAADVGEQFNLNTRNENQLRQSSQFPNPGDIEQQQGCWWVSVPIPTDDATPVDGDQYYCAGKNKNLPHKGFYGADGVGASSQPKFENRGYSTLNAPRQMPTTFDTRHLFKDNMSYFNDGKDFEIKMPYCRYNADLKEHFNQDLSNGNSYAADNVGGHLNQSNPNEHQVIQAANEDIEQQSGWWSSVPIFHMHSDRDGYLYYKFECTIEQIDDLLFNDEVEEAVKILKELETRKGIYVDLPRYLQLIQACGKEGTLQYGRDVYDNLIRSSTPIDVNTYNKILHMYSDCGSMFDAYEIFENKMPQHNLRSWDAMIRGLAKNGHGEDAVDLFTQFEEAGLKPDGEMFMGVFLVCSFLSDIETGMLHFDSMSKVYGIVPSMEHYVSVVNMLGSTGYLDEAMDFIERMPYEPSIEVWETLANLFWIHGNIKLGDHCSEIINCLDPSRVNKLKKGIVPGKTCDAKQKRKESLFDISLSSAKYDDEYTSQHEQTKIFALLRGMSDGHMKEAGYVPETGSVPFTLEEEEKENYLVLHGKKIALALSMLSSEPRSPVHMADFTLSTDCHDSMKIISKLVGREIKVINGFTHTFRKGLCSCNDLWVPWSEPLTKSSNIRLEKRLEAMAGGSSELFLEEPWTKVLRSLEEDFRNFRNSV